jgi:hypothetical protein
MAATDTLKNRQCAVCNGSLTGGAVPLAARCACCPAGKPDPARHDLACSTDCRDRGARRTIARLRRCAGCASYVDVGAVREDGSIGPSDRSPYCTPECEERLRESRELARKELKRSTLNYKNVEDWQAALARGVGLWECWCGRTPDKPEAPPPDAARVALRVRVERVQAGLEEAHADRWREQHEEAERRRQRGWRARLERRQEADRRWREQL